MGHLCSLLSPAAARSVVFVFGFPACVLQMSAFLHSLSLLCLLILNLACRGCKRVKHRITLAWQTTFRRAPSLQGCQNSFTFREASANIFLPSFCLFMRAAPFPFCSPQTCLLLIFFSSWYNLSLLFIFHIFPSLFQSCQLSPVITLISFLSHISSGKHPAFCPSVLFHRSEHNSSRERLGTSRDFYSIFWVMSRASRWRFHAGGGLPVCRKSLCLEDGVKHLWLRCSSDAVNYLNTTCPTEPGAVREELGV